MNVNDMTREEASALLLSIMNREKQAWEAYESQAAARQKVIDDAVAAGVGDHDPATLLGIVMATETEAGVAYDARQDEHKRNMAVAHELFKVSQGRRV